MLARVPLLVVALLALAPFATTTAQEETPVVLRLEGHEGPLECDPTALQILCFTTVEGDPATAFSAGATVRVELTAKPLEGAPGGAPHNLAVGIDGEQGDLQGIDSDSSAALGVSDTAESGATVTLEFTVPESGTLYFWCDVGEHEAFGMRFTAEVQPAADPGGNDTTGNGTEDETGSRDNGTADDNATSGGNTSGTTGDAPPADAETDAGADVNTTDAPAAGADEAEESPAMPMLALPLVGGALLAIRRRRA